MANNSMMAKNVFFSFESKKQQNGKQIKSWERKEKRLHSMEKKIQLTLGTDYKTFYGRTEIS